MLAQSAQACFYRKITYPMLSWCACANIVKENYLRNVHPQAKNNFAEENKPRCCLDLLREEITCVMFVHT